MILTFITAVVQTSGAAPWPATCSNASFPTNLNRVKVRAAPTILHAPVVYTHADPPHRLLLCLGERVDVHDWG